MAKIDFMDNMKRETFLHTFLLMGLTDSGKLTEIMSQEGFDASNLNVKFSVNGFDLPVEETIARIDDGLDRLIEKKAIELLNERFNKLNESIEEFQDNIMEKVKKTFKFEGEWD